MLTVVTALPVFSSSEKIEAEKVRRKAISDSLTRVLPSIKSPKERVEVLYDIFDLAPTDSVTVTGERVLEAAKEAGDTASIFDMMRRLASFNQTRDASRVLHYLDEIQTYPSTPEADATECFIYLCAMTSQSRYSTDGERYRHISNLVHDYSQHKDETTSTNDRVALLFTLCNYLGLSLPGEVLSSYLNELESLLKEMPYRLVELENMYYTRAAKAYSDNNQAGSSVAADRELLKVIDKMDAASKQSGRKYRDYDFFRYSTYRRMLSNADALAPAEIDQIYAMINKLKARCPEVEADMEAVPTAEAYYLFAKGRYAQAQPQLLKSLDNETRPTARRNLLRMLVKTSAETNDAAVHTMALEEYNKVLEEALNQRTLERARELKALYNVSEPEFVANADSGGETSVASKSLMITCGVLVLLMVGAVVWFVILYRRSHRLSLELQESNRQLLAERDNMKKVQANLIEARDQARKANRHKSDFINNMSHEVSTPLNALVECAHLIVDNVSEEKRRYLDRFARTIDLSAGMLRTLVNDVLEVNNIESGKMMVQRSTVPVATLCQAAIQSLKPYVKPGVELRWINQEEGDEVIYTDPLRVEQVLVNLLSNGLKFTEKGYVELSCKVDAAAGTATFTVTDTGIGVPEGKEELIFGRFEKLSSLTQGTGLGLSISRMIANLLNAKLFVDTTYQQEGSRFVFIIPSLP